MSDDTYRWLAVVIWSGIYALVGLALLAAFGDWPSVAWTFGFPVLTFGTLWAMIAGSERDDVAAGRQLPNGYVRDD